MKKFFRFVIIFLIIAGWIFSGQPAVLSFANETTSTSTLPSQSATSTKLTVFNHALVGSVLNSPIIISVAADNFVDLTQMKDYWADDCLPNIPDNWRIVAVDDHNNYYLGPEHNINLTNPIYVSDNFSLPGGNYALTAVIWGTGVFDQTNSCGIRWLEWKFDESGQNSTIFKISNTN